MSELSEWFKSLPLFTRYWMALTALFSLAGRFQILNPMYLILTYEGVFSKFQIWRLVTCLFYYPINSATGIHFIFNLYFLYNYSLRLETVEFQGRPADYSFLLIFGWICNALAGLILEYPFLMDSAVMTVLYIWCQLNKETIVNFWFGTIFKAMYLPWVLFLFNLIVNGRGMLDLVGIVIGHLYFFLMYQYPQEFNGPVILSTPSYLYKLFPNQRLVAGFGATPVRRAQEPNQGQAGGGGGFHLWGQGHVLGGR